MMKKHYGVLISRGHLLQRRLLEICELVELERVGNHDAGWFVVVSVYGCEILSHNVPLYGRGRFGVSQNLCVKMCV